MTPFFRYGIFYIFLHNKLAFTDINIYNKIKNRKCKCFAFTKIPKDDKTS